MKEENIMPRVDVDECPKCHRKLGERHKATMTKPSLKTLPFKKKHIFYF
jgi:hypothetical protein